MKNQIRGAAFAAAVAVLALVGVQAANAATVKLYDNENYQTLSYSGGTTATVPHNDQASSVQSSGSYTLYEDINYGGRSVGLSGNYNALQAVSTNLHFGETWNDRVSSLIS